MSTRFFDKMQVRPSKNATALIHRIGHTTLCMRIFFSRWYPVIASSLRRAARKRRTERGGERFHNAFFLPQMCIPCCCTLGQSSCLDKFAVPVARTRFFAPKCVYHVVAHLVCGFALINTPCLWLARAFLSLNVYTMLLHTLSIILP